MEMIFGIALLAAAGYAGYQAGLQHASHTRRGNPQNHRTRRRRR